jgi:ABC-type xylose transport system substrate-binding protein
LQCAKTKSVYKIVEVESVGKKRTKATVMAAYSTKARALQVMDEIQKHICSIELKRFMGKEDEIFVTPIYTMPAE